MFESFWNFSKQEKISAYQRREILKIRNVFFFVPSYVLSLLPLFNLSSMSSPNGHFFIEKLRSCDLERSKWNCY